MKKLKMKTHLVQAFVLCICLTACFSGQTGYVYQDGSWRYVTNGGFDAGRGEKSMDAEKNDLKILADKKFARSKENIYYEGRIVEDADPDTFRVIFAEYNSRYAIDKNNVYLFFDNSIYKLYSADPDSFEVVNFPYAKDKNDAYCGILPLFVDDVTKFEVIEGAGLSTATSADAFLSDEWHNAWYNREKYGFVTGSVIYPERGKAKTETRDYYGYIAVETYDPYHLKTYADLTSFGLGCYELRHEGVKKLYDVTDPSPVYVPAKNKRYYETWDTFHKGMDVMYDVVYYGDTYIIIPPIFEKQNGYYWDFIYLCKALGKDADMFSIGILDPEVLDKLRELPGEQISRKDIVEKLGKIY